MQAVIFEVTPTNKGKAQYLDIASTLRDKLCHMDGFISIERFQSLVEEDKLLSLSFWESDAAITQWRTQVDHLLAQQLGRSELFESYRIRVAQVVRDYTQDQRTQAPQ